MAYVASFIRHRVAQRLTKQKDYNITIRVQVIDDTRDPDIDPETGFDNNAIFVKHYQDRYNDGIALDDIFDRVSNLFADDWKKWIDEQKLFNHAEFSALTDKLQTAANVLINK